MLLSAVEDIYIARDDALPLLNSHAHMEIVQDSK